MNLKPGTLVKLGEREGTVLRKVGPHAVKVRTAFCKSHQDFATGKITELSGMREENWPIARLTN